ALIEEAQVLPLAEGGEHLVFLGNELPEVQLQLAPGQAGVARVAGIVEQSRRLDQVLGGQAAPVDARAADSARLGHDRPLAQLKRGDGGGEGCRAAAQDHQIVPVCHCVSISDEPSLQRLDLMLYYEIIISYIRRAAWRQG